MVALHLSDQLFDLVLNLTFDYAATNAKSNAVRAFGQLIACLARAQPQKTLDKFLPTCISRVQDELKYGASSVRTTSTHDPIPSDTTLHWSKWFIFCLTSNQLPLARYVDTAWMSWPRRTCCESDLSRSKLELMRHQF